MAPPFQPFPPLQEALVLGGQYCTSMRLHQNAECERNATLVAAAGGAEGNGGKRITAKSANWEPYERSWNGTNGNAESIRENEAFPYPREENAAGARADPRRSEQQPATRGRALE